MIPHGLRLNPVLCRGSGKPHAVDDGNGQWGRHQEVGVSPLVRAFWEETGIELTGSCMKLCWELPPRGVFRRRERGTVAPAITFMDDMAMCIPRLDAWDQFVWPLGAAVLWAAMEVEQYGYRYGQAVDLGPIMLATQFRVTNEVGTYLCATWALVFEGSILAYNPTRDEAEWVPARGITNDLSWAEEESAVVLANYVPHISQEAAGIANLGARHLVSWPNDPSSQEEEEEEDGQEEEEEPTEVEEQGEASPEPSPHGMVLEQGETEQEAEPHR